MSDNPEETEFYALLCHRLCELAGVATVVPKHYRFSDNERRIAHELGAVANTVAAMDEFGLAYVSEHWPVGGGECGGGAELACRFLLANAS